MLSCDVPAGCWEPLRTLFYRAFVPDGTFGMSGGSLSTELWPLSGLFANVTIPCVWHKPWLCPDGDSSPVEGNRSDGHHVPQGHKLGRM